jgi:chromosome segregation ATPase
MSKELNDKSAEMQKLKDKLTAYQKLESQYNSDKHVYKMNMEELQNKIQSLEYQLNLQEESRQDVEGFWRGSDENLKSSQEKVAKLEMENALLKDSINKVGNESS